MKLVYERPTLDTKFNAPYDISFLRVGSAEDVKRMQEHLLDITDLAAKFLKEHELPQGIDGEALINFRGYTAKAAGQGKFIRRISVAGVVGFPSISIQTDLGVSSVSLHPEQDLGFVTYRLFPNHPNREYGNHIQIQGSGEGLADKVAQEILPVVNSKFATRPAKVESYGDHQPSGYLSKRIIVPI